MKSFLTWEASRGVNRHNRELWRSSASFRWEIVNVQNIVKSHFEELTKLPVVHNNDDTTKLRELCYKIETNLKRLRPIGIQTDTCGYVLVPILKNKLPKQVNLLLRRKFDPRKKLWEIEEIDRVKNWVRSHITLHYRKESQKR